MRRPALFAVVLIAALAIVVARGSTHEQARAAGGGCSAGSLCVTSSDDHTPNGCDSECTLREALLVLGDQQTVQFDIPGPGPHVIHLAASEGDLTPIGGRGAMIDGFSQPGSSPNTAGLFQLSNANIQIVLDGSAGLHTGLWVKANGDVIQGLSIVNFQEEAIFVSTLAPTALIQGNYIGVMPDGQTAGPNGIGVLIRSSESGNQIGGASPGARNVISGNTGPGIRVTGGSPLSINGNFVGTDSTGMNAVPNGDVGIDMAGGRASAIGGGQSGNLISGNAAGGIRLSTPDGSDMNVRGNLIGVKRDGVTPLPNGGDGIQLTQGAANNTLGGDTNVTEENVIAYNMGAGVGLTVSAGVDNYIDPNSIYNNDGLGADIKDDGLVLPNDHLDYDGGDGGGPAFANRLNNYPVITAASYDGTKLTFTATVDTVPNSGYRPFFIFWNDQCDPSGYGEGQHFIRGWSFQVGASGQAEVTDMQFTVALTGTVYLTMSTSDPESSSEFSACFPLDTGISTPQPTGTAGSETPTPTPTVAPSVTPTAAPLAKQGDMNCDDETTPGDVTQFLNFLATSERGPAPSGCPNPGDGVGSNIFLDLNCDRSTTALDALYALSEFAGITPPGLTNGCPRVGDRLS